EYKEQFQGEAYINGVFAEEINIVYPGVYNIEIRDNDYSHQYSIIVEPDIVINGDMINNNYYGEIQIYSFGELYLNGEFHTSGVTISEAGEYILEIHGVNDYVESITLLLYPYIYYNNGKDNFILKEDSNIDYPIRLFAKTIDLYVNGEIYNNELINKPGSYQLYYNLNNLEENIEFNIYPRIEGIKNNEVYSSVDFYVFGEAIINGEEYQGLVSINDPGEYHLELYFNTDIYQTIDFEIQKFSSKPNISNYIKYGFIGILGIGVMIFFWKK
ncbi:MAG: hypothetical protein K9L64_03890, partial [Candidatus Izimaplasma sp.]|nr:hypothetical protein [Candidatus Izimaplasma bacterium]